MKELDQFLVPYLVSQAVGIGNLLAAWKNTSIARLLFALLFVGASALNMHLGLTKPDTYLVYADMAVPLYRDFINGWFRDYSQIIIPMIAIGQFAIGVGMLLRLVGAMGLYWSCYLFSEHCATYDRFCFSFFTDYIICCMAGFEKR